MNLPASQARIEAAETAVGLPLPGDYKAFLSRSNGGRFALVSEMNALLWAAEDLPQLNQAYEAAANMPGFVLIGSTDSGDAVAIDTRSGSVLTVPFVGLRERYAAAVAPCFQEAVRPASPADQIAAAWRSSDAEAFFVHPLVLGGDPVDPKNRITMNRADHIAAVRYWNRIIFEVESQNPG